MSNELLKKTIQDLEKQEKAPVVMPLASPVAYFRDLTRLGQIANHEVTPQSVPFVIRSLQRVVQREKSVSRRSI